MWYIYTMEYYAAEKNNDIMKFAGKWMELENVILSEFFKEIFNFLFKGLYHLLKVIFSDEFCFFCVGSCTHMSTANLTNVGTHTTVTKASRVLHAPELTGSLPQYDLNRYLPSFAHCASVASASTYTHITNAHLASEGTCTHKLTTHLPDGLFKHLHLNAHALLYVHLNSSASAPLDSEDTYTHMTSAP
ncbi:hypothetical protein STEG23_029388 [Scotinomys teguina]